MIFMVPCVLVHAFLAHNTMFVFTVKHQIFLMEMTLCSKASFSPRVASAVFVSVIFFWIITRLAAPFGDVRGFTFSPNIWKPLRICHLFKFPFCESRFLWIVRDCLSQRALIEFWALQVIKQELIIFLVDEIFHIMSESIFLAFWAYQSKLGIQRWDTFRNFDFLCTAEANLMITYEGNRRCENLVATSAVVTHPT